MKIVGVVTTYFPNLEELQQNIDSYIDELDTLIIWENTPHENSHLNIFKNNPKIIIWTTGKNEGIGVALNAAAKWATEHSFPFLLTMDQDSSFQPGQFKEFVRLVEKHENDSFGIYAPVRSKIQQSNILQETDHVITSGSLINTKIFPVIGYFMEELFIDMVDFEFSIRTTMNGYKIIYFPQIYLNHQLGYRIKNKWGFMLNNYSPLRTYYIIRNWHAVRKMYPHSYLHTSKEEKTFSHTFGRYRFFKIILFEKNKFAKLKAYLLGYYHGKKGKLSYRYPN